MVGFTGEPNLSVTLYAVMSPPAPWTTKPRRSGTGSATIGSLPVRHARREGAGLARKRMDIAEVPTITWSPTIRGLKLATRERVLLPRHWRRCWRRARDRAVVGDSAKRASRSMPTLLEKSRATRGRVAVRGVKQAARP